MPDDAIATTLTSIHQMTPHVKQYLLRADDTSFEYKPGQHTCITFERDGEVIRRPYTPVNLPGTPIVALGIKTYANGTCSRWMDSREHGDTVHLTPFGGNLHLRSLDRNVVFLSTGTGITPMIAMLRHYLRDGTGQATFLYGERTQQDIMYRETIDLLDAEHDALSVGYALSDEDWDGPTGHIQDHLDAYVDTFEDTDFYICGVPQMVVDTEDVLYEHGVDDQHIINEGWEAGAVAN